MRILMSVTAVALLQWACATRPLQDSRDLPGSPSDGSTAEADLMNEAGPNTTLSFGSATDLNLGIGVQDPASGILDPEEDLAPSRRCKDNETVVMRSGTYSCVIIEEMTGSR